MTKGHCNGQSKHAPVKKSRGGATLAPRGHAQPLTQHTHIAPTHIGINRQINLPTTTQRLRSSLDQIIVLHQLLAQWVT
jgi:hypothetical protein